MSFPEQTYRCLCQQSFGFIQIKIGPGSDVSAGLNPFQDDPQGDVLPATAVMRSTEWKNRFPILSPIPLQAMGTLKAVAAIRVIGSNRSSIFVSRSCGSLSTAIRCSLFSRIGACLQRHMLRMTHARNRVRTYSGVKGWISQSVTLDSEPTSESASATRITGKSQAWSLSIARMARHGSEKRWNPDPFDHV